MGKELTLRPYFTTSGNAYLYIPQIIRQMCDIVSGTVFMATILNDGTLNIKQEVFHGLESAANNARNTLSSTH